MKTFVIYLVIFTFLLASFASLLFPIAVAQSENLNSSQTGSQLYLPLSSNSTASNITLPRGLIYRVDSQSYLNSFSYVSVLASIQVNNTGSTATQPEPLSVSFPSYYATHLLSFNSSGITLTESVRNNTLYFTGNLPSIQPGQGMLITLGLRLWGMVSETAPSPGTSPTYYFATPSIPKVSLTGGYVYNATSTIGLPSSVTVMSIPNINNSVYSQLATNLYFYVYRNASNIFPSTVNISFSPSSASTSSFAIYRVDRIVRIITLGQNGQLNVQDYVTILNNDLTALTSVSLTSPASGQFQISAGVVRPRYISLSSGTLSVSNCYQAPTSAPSCQPIPVEPRDHATFVIYYTLPSSAITRSSGGLQLNLSKGTLIYPSFYGNYSVLVSLPKGSSYQFLTQSNFTNVASIPPVVVMVNIPFGYQLDPVVGVAFAVLIIVVAVFSIYAVRNRGGPEAQVDSIIKEKKEVITWLLDDIRQRGEGFAPYAYFTEERKQYEEARNRLNAKINILREQARKDKSYRQAVDRLVAEDGKIEQVYRESRQLLEDKLSGKIDESQFRERIRNLQQRLQA
ncbi:MAG: hypothetical protein QXV32_02715 [Conexivisphaerales archaeon]